jgi:hypothetical protein
LVGAGLATCASAAFTGVVVVVVDSFPTGGGVLLLLLFIVETLPVLDEGVVDEEAGAIFLEQPHTITATVKMVKTFFISVCLFFF